MRRVVLVRHAKAVRQGPEQADSDRQLAPRGARDAALIGRELAQRGISPDRVVSSPAVRALATARHIAAALNYPAERIYIEPDMYTEYPDTLAACIRSADDTCRELLVVGHNPAVTLLAQQWLPEHDITFSTGAVLCLDSSAAHWREISADNAGYVFFLSPER